MAGLRGKSGKASSSTPYRDRNAGTGPETFKVAGRGTRAVGGVKSSTSKGSKNPMPAPKKGRASNPTGKFRGGGTR